MRPCSSGICSQGPAAPRCSPLLSGTVCASPASDSTSCRTELYEDVITVSLSGLLATGSFSGLLVQSRRPTASLSLRWGTGEPMRGSPGWNRQLNHAPGRQGGPPKTSMGLGFLSEAPRGPSAVRRMVSNTSAPGHVDPVAEM